MLANYILLRLLSVPPILFGISVVAFLILRFLPGDVATLILAGGGAETVAVDPAAAAALRDQMGLNEPLFVQYIDWIWGLLNLDAGMSLWTNRPAMDEIMRRLPLSLELAILSFIIALIFAIPVGIAAAIWQDSWLDYLFRTVTIGGLALPVFWTGTIGMLCLTLWFNWAPPLGFVPFSRDPWTNIQQLLPPAIVIGYANGAVIARMVRSTTLEVLREDYIRTAQSKGLGFGRIMGIHVLRNAAVPVLTLCGVEFGLLIGGMVVMEKIFTLPGLGRLLVDSIQHRDYPVVQTIILILGVAFILLNLAVDLLCGLIDPRIRQGKGQAK